VESCVNQKGLGLSDGSVLAVGWVGYPRRGWESCHTCVRLKGLGLSAGSDLSWVG